MLIFSGVETASYSRNFQYIGDSYNFRNLDTLSLNGRMAYVPYCDGSGGAGAGFAFVDDGLGWVSFPGGGGATGTFIGTDSGYYCDWGDGAFVAVEDGGVLGIYLKNRGCTSMAVGNIWSGMDTIINSFPDWQEIVVEGVSLGSGVVKSISFPSSSDATERRFSVSIEIPKEGDINNFGGTGFNGLTVNGDKLRHVNDLSETFSIERNKNGQIAMQRSVSLTMISGAVGDPVEAAKSVASGFINTNDPLLGVINYPSFYSSADRRFEESYDAVRGQYSWTELLTKDEADKTYIFSYGLSMNQDQAGITSITEDGRVIGLTSSPYDAAVVGWGTVKPFISTRVGEFYNSYNTGAGSLQLADSSLTRNEVGGEISYRYSFTDNPFEKLCVRHGKTIDISRGQDNSYIVTEQGEIVGKCGETYTGRFQTAKDYFETNVRPNIASTAQSYFESYRLGTGCGTENLTSSTHEISYAEFDSKVSYNFGFSNRSSDLDNSNFRASRVTEISDSIPTMGFEITPYCGEVAQYQRQSEMVTERQVITLQGKSDSLTNAQYLSRAINLLVEPAGDAVYIADTSYSFEPDANQMSLTVSYRYPGSRSRNNSDV